jgi:hypothetical protein
MKKVFVFFVVEIVLFGACSAQNANAQNTNIAQRIIGTWIDQTGETWVFNANGTLDGYPGAEKFGVTETKLAFYYVSSNGVNLILYNISMSSDGRTLILDFSNSDNKIGSYLCYSYWLTKK